jgi:hypothetical protein
MVKAMATPSADFPAAAAAAAAVPGKSEPLPAVTKADYVYVEYSAECSWVHPDMDVPDHVEKTMRVTLRFDSAHQHWVAEDNDQLYRSFERGLPDGWTVDDVIEPARVVPKAQAAALFFTVWSADF